MGWAGMAALAALAPGVANATLDYDLQPPVTPIAQQMYDLNVYIFWICVVIFVRRLRRDVLFDLQAPQVDRAQGARSSTRTRRSKSSGRSFRS